MSEEERHPVRAAITDAVVAAVEKVRLEFAKGELEWKGRPLSSPVNVDDYAIMTELLSIASEYGIRHGLTQPSVIAGEVRTIASSQAKNRRTDIPQSGWV